MTLSTEAVISALQQIEVPGAGRSVAHTLLDDLEIEGGNVRLVLVAGAAGARDAALLDDIRKRLLALPGASEVEVLWKQPAAARTIGEDDPVPGARNVILVMSGKGGVGKSTVAANLALCLHARGHRVGLLDADIYGPSIPTMFGISGHPTSDGQKIHPLKRFGIKLMSIGFLLDDPTSAVVWRGPMLHSALIQFLKDVDWGKLDFLLLDLPPGTGDVALTLSQRVRATGAVIVTTPQEVALQDVYKSVSMAQKVGIPVLGIVENESYFVCDGCEKRHDIFGSGGGERVAEMAQAPLLGQIPLDTRVRQWGDAGTPVVRAEPASPSARALIEVTDRLLARVNEAAPEASPVAIDRSGGVNRHLPVQR